MGIVTEFYPNLQVQTHFLAQIWEKRESVDQQ